MRENDLYIETVLVVPGPELIVYKTGPRCEVVGSDKHVLRNAHLNTSERKITLGPVIYLLTYLLTYFHVKGQCCD